METISNFIINNYLWFLIITIVLILALIGYFVDVKLNGIDSPYRTKKSEFINGDFDMSKIEISQDMTISSAVNKTQNQSLADMMSNINEEKNVSQDNPINDDTETL